MTIGSTQDVNRLISTGSATDENIEGIINQGSNVLEQPNQNKAYVVPEQPSTMPQAAFRSSNNVSQTVGTAESHGSISTSRLDQPNQNMILSGPENDSRDGDKVTGLNSQVNNGPLDNVEEKDSMEAKLNPLPSNLEASSGNSDKVTGLNSQVNNGPLDNVEEKDSMEAKLNPLPSNLEASSGNSDKVTGLNSQVNNGPLDNVEEKDSMEAKLNPLPSNLEASSGNSDKVTGLNSQVNNGPLDNVEEKDSMETKLEPFSSNLEASMQLLNNKTRQDTPLDQNLQPPLKGLGSGLSDELIKLFPTKKDWFGNLSASGLVTCTRSKILDAYMKQSRPYSKLE